jgi:glycosylphosphatidylinositol phospholipase D
VYILKNTQELKSGMIQDNILYSLSYYNASASRFGYSMAVVDLNKDGIDDLAISAPTHGGLDLEYNGRVYVYFGSNVTGLHHDPDLIIEPKIKQPYHRPGQEYMNQFTFFGEKLYAWDVDGDGFKDLVIASPRAASLPYRHQVFYPLLVKRRGF